jgi:hypothetical protein
MNIIRPGNDPYYQTQTTNKTPQPPKVPTGQSRTAAVASSLNSGVGLPPVSKTQQNAMNSSMNQ